MNDQAERPDLEDLSEDEVIAILTGKCLHEVKLGRIMALLGLAADAAGGKLELRMEDLEGLGGIAIAIDKSTGLVTVEVMPSPPADTPTPTHEAPPTRQ